MDRQWLQQVAWEGVASSPSCHRGPYDLRHSFASLLLHEGRSSIYVARQLGHAASLTDDLYGHVIDELEQEPGVSVEAAIRSARKAHVPVSYPRAAIEE